MAEWEQKSEASNPGQDYFDLMKELQEYGKNAESKAPYMFGYPNNLRDVGRLFYDVHGALPKNMVLDNCLDPYLAQQSHMKIQTEKHEKILVQEIARPWIKPHLKDLLWEAVSSKSQISQNLWGYVATDGTEGNMKGLLTGVQNLKKKHIVLFSGEAHFSIPKAIEVLEQSAIMIKAKNNGVMDLHDLEKVLEIVKREGYEQVILMPTLGTTFKGAVDDLDGLLDVMKKYYDRSDIYIHLDAAFFGGWWHLLDDAPKYYLGEHFDSFSVSGHKFYGGIVASCFFTCANVPATSAEYLNTDDKELSGSKNGFNPVMWRARLRQFDWKQEYVDGRQRLKLLEEGLRKRGIPCFSNPHSLITVFPEPSNAICDRFQLATLKGWTHVCNMPHITTKDIIEFLDEIDASGDAKKMAAKKDYTLDETGWPGGIVSQQ